MSLPQGTFVLAVGWLPGRALMGWRGVCSVCELGETLVCTVGCAGGMYTGVGGMVGGGVGCAGGVYTGTGGCLGADGGVAGFDVPGMIVTDGLGITGGSFGTG